MKNWKNIVVFIFILTIICGYPLNSKGIKKTVFSFIPFETKNIISVNLKVFFKQYKYNDIYKFNLGAENKAFFKKIFLIIKNAGIAEQDLDSLLITSNDLIDSVDMLKHLSEMVAILKLTYNPVKLEKTVLRYYKNNNDIKKSKFGRKTTLTFGEMFKFSMCFFDNQTILIGKNNNVQKYINTLSKKKNILFNNRFDSVLRIIKKKPLLSYYVKFSNFFNNIFEYIDKTLKVNLKNVNSVYGSISLDRSMYSGKINIISNNKRSNKLTVTSLKKALAISSMGGIEYIKLANKININEGKNGMRIFFTFDIE